MHLPHIREKFLVSGFLFLLLVASLYLALQQTGAKNSSATNTATSAADIYQTQQLRIGASVINVEIADTEAEIVRGLSYRDSLGESDGMYFVFPARRQVSFWMYQMRFPLDIVWIDNGAIVGIEQNAPVPTGESIPTFKSPQAVTHVLEVPAGFSGQNNLKIGDKVVLIK